jgi:hypothetical protein
VNRRKNPPERNRCQIEMIVTIALGFVAGQILWELLLEIARWAGQVSVRAVAFVLRRVAEAPRTQRARLEVRE